jgi:hypothetical protein
MADHSKPLTSSTYANFVTELDSRIDDVTAALDPAYVTATNLVTNAVRFSSAAAKWQRWTGSTWVDLAASNSYAIDISGNATTVTNGVVTTGSFANPAWITSLAGSKISGDISGNAATATALATARTINGVSFNGTAAITVNTNTNLTFNNGGGGAASGTTFNGSTAATISYNTIGAAAIGGSNATGTWPISINGTVGATTANTGAFTTLTASGSAATPPVVVAFSATAMAINCALSNVFTTTFTANVTTAPTFSNLADGQTINWFITQDATGSRTITWPTSFKWSGGSSFAGVLSTGANAVDLLVATYRSSTGFWYAALSKGFA